MCNKFRNCLIAGSLLIRCVLAQQVPASAPSPLQNGSYVLGPGDTVSVWALGVDEISSDKPYTVLPDGYVDLPMAGRVQLAGKTIDDAKQQLRTALQPYFRDPQVSLAVTDFRSQPVSVLGCVKTPGVIQLQGGKSLLEVVSLAGGSAPEADSIAIITRQIDWGPIPLPDSKVDPSGKFYTAKVDLDSLSKGNSPEQNIKILPNDVINVPKARLIYVLGEVTKPGGFVLHQDEKVSAVQALSMAGGATAVAGVKNARILRGSSNPATKQDIPMNLRAALEGKGEDLQMRPEDILYVPGNASKKASVQAIQSGIQIATGLIIWRR
jgi:polysaccharide export outer membrane protein